MRILRVLLLCALLAGVAAAQDMGGGPPPGGGPAMGGPPPGDMGGGPPPDADGPPPPPPGEGTSAADRAPVSAQSDSNSGAPQQSQDQAAPPAQEGSGQGQAHRGGGMHRGVTGEITAINADGFTLKTMQGNSATVKISGETKFVRDQQPIKLSDLKVGNTVQVAGTPDANDPTTWNAVFISDRTKQAEEFKQNLGKTIVIGEVKSIDGTNLTIAMPNGQTVTVAADENTSFKKGRDSITLADIKAGDHIMGRGTLKNGTFVASELRLGGMGMGMGGGRGNWQGRGQGQGQGQGAQGGAAPPQ